MTTNNSTDDRYGHTFRTFFQDPPQTTDRTAPDRFPWKGDAYPTHLVAKSMHIT